MKTFLILGLLPILIAFNACKKENEPKPAAIVYDTIKPSDYFPAYPGSYWIYDNNDTLKVDKYEKYIFNSTAFDALPDFDTLVLPKLILNGIYNPENQYAYVNGNSISNPSNSSYRDYPFRNLFREEHGAGFTVTSSWENHSIEGQTIKIDTSIVVKNKKYENVIVIIHYDTYWTQQLVATGSYCAHLKEYYARNVGLIKREKRNFPDDSEFYTDIELIEYEIK